MKKTLIAALAITLSLLAVTPAFAETQDQFLNRCGCSQEVLRLDGNSSEQDKFCEDAPLDKGDVDFYASRPSFPNPLGGVMDVLGLAVKLIFGSSDGNTGDLTRGINANLPGPEVVVQPGTERPKEGDILTITADNRGYSQPHDDDTNLQGGITSQDQPPQHNYRLTTWAVDDLTQQGLVAGGKKPVEQIEKLVDARGNQIGPVPNPVYANKKACRLVTRTPLKDRDGDGMDDQWEVDNFPQYFAGEKNADRVTIAQLTKVDPAADPDGDGFLLDGPRRLKAAPLDAVVLFGNPIHLAPDSTGGVTGDGTWNNREEFDWDTNPSDKDSDHDGVTDEADVAGLGQSTFVMPIIDTGVESHEVRATTVGFTQQRRNFIASGTAKIITNNVDPLVPQLSMTPDHPDRDHVPVFVASVSNVDQLGSHLAYTWTLNGEVLPATVQGENKFTLDLAPFAAKLKEKNRIDVSMMDERTKQIAFATQEFRFGTGALLSAAKLVPDDHCAANMCQCEPDTSTHAAEIGPGEYVRVNADGAVLQVPDADKKNLNYIWTLDNTHDDKQSGIGQANLCFQASATAGTTHAVKLTVLNQLTGKIEAQDDLAIAVEDFAADLSVAPTTVETGGRVDARVQNIRNIPAGESVTFAWTLDGLGVAGHDNDPSLAFTAGLPGTTHHISVRIQAGIGHSVVKNAQVTVTEKTGAPTATAPVASQSGFFSQLRASMQHAFSSLHL